MNFGRRITLYLFGFSLGALIVWFGLMKDRPDDALTSWLPSKRVIMQLDTNKQVPSASTACWMSCRGVSAQDLKFVIKNGEVMFGKSDVHAKPVPKYVMEGKTPKGLKLSILCAAGPTQTDILSCSEPGNPKDTCNCR